MPLGVCQYRLLCAWSASFGKLLPWQCLVHSMQSSTPSVRTSLPTPMLYADRVRFHLPLPLGACVLVWSASAVGGFPATDCHWALALFLWLGICRPCAVSPPLTLGAFALATGRLSVSALVCLVSKLRKAAPVENASCTRCRPPRHPSGHPSRHSCCMPTVCGFTCHFRWALVPGRLPLFVDRHLPTVCGFPATDTGRVCACHWAFALLCVARHLPTVCGFPATDTGRACACHWAFALFLVARHLPIVCGFPATDTGRACAYHWAFALFLN